MTTQFLTQTPSRVIDPRTREHAAIFKLAERHADVLPDWCGFAIRCLERGLSLAQVEQELAKLTGRPAPSAKTSEYCYHGRAIDACLPCLRDHMNASAKAFWRERRAGGAA